MIFLAWILIRRRKKSLDFRERSLQTTFLHARTRVRLCRSSCDLYINLRSKWLKMHRKLRCDTGEILPWLFCITITKILHKFTVSGFLKLCLQFFFFKTVFFAFYPGFRDFRGNSVKRKTLGLKINAPPSEPGKSASKTKVLKEKTVVPITELLFHLLRLN